MVSREKKRVALYEKLQLLRTVTNSHAQIDNTSIILDASKYIEELKQKVERLNEDIASSQYTNDQKSLPQVTVETLEKGLLVNVFSNKCCSGLLVFILETFEELGLSVLEARVSCADCFRLQAVGGENQVIDAQVVKQAVWQAINHWNGSDD
ncbi:hypothetical protein GIB67_020233 [Kingdonia uniflora]|uniref:Plant bHLH transcription factor ACT-like domain-containing protein n=1 Tax=Kingdonia uniflora TaxID=39325 RepID=A0A7J7P3N8_9MAGN|nr:hypothetical protein GIB67_020233 [Kingdonia uniflora]